VSWDGTRFIISGSNSSLQISGSAGTTTIQGGKLTTVDGEFSGKIEATEGKIGGWDITPVQIQSTGITAGNNNGIVLHSVTSEDYIRMFDENGINRFDLNTSTSILSPDEPGVVKSGQFTNLPNPQGVSVNRSISGESTDSANIPFTSSIVTIDTGDVGLFDIQVSYNEISLPSGNVISLSVNVEDDEGAIGTFAFANATITPILEIRRDPTGVNTLIKSIVGTSIFRSVNSIGGTQTVILQKLPSQNFTDTVNLSVADDYIVQIVLSIQVSATIIDATPNAEAESFVSVQEIDPLTNITLSRTNAATTISGGGFQSVIDQNRWIRISDKNLGLSSPGLTGTDVPGTHIRGGLGIDGIYQNNGTMGTAGNPGLTNPITFTNINKDIPSFSLIKAFVVFVARTTNGQCTIQSAANVSGVARDGQGVYIITFQNPMVDTNYGVTATAATAGSGNNTVRIVGVRNRTENNCQISINTSGNDSTDTFQFCTVMILG
jgi:hypothetical protein